MDLLKETAAPQADVQDAFDSLLMCEERFVQEGYNEGLKAGQEIGHQEGFHLGLKKGKEIGSEIGFYRGFAKGWISILRGSSEVKQSLLSLTNECASCLDSATKSELQDVIRQIGESRPDGGEIDLKASKALQKLLQLSEAFPQENLKDRDFQEQLSALRAKFKHCCAILKVENSISTSQNKQLNF